MDKAEKWKQDKEDADTHLCKAMTKIEELQNAYGNFKDLEEQCSSMIRKLESVQEDLQLLQKDKQS